jgi:hypothetical protein
MPKNPTDGPGHFRDVKFYESPESLCHAYGEMVDVLWKAGQDAAAIRVELLWNTLATTHDFSHSQVVSRQGVFIPAPRPNLN